MIYDNINALAAMLIFGSTILLAFVKFSNPLNINKKGNHMFAVFLLLLASFWVEEVAEFSGFGIIHTGVLAVIHSVQIFTAPSIYFSILLYTIPAFRFNLKHLIHLIFPAVYIFLYLYILLAVPETGLLRSINVGIMLTLSSFYSVYSYLELRRHKKSLLQYSSDIKDKSLDWLEYMLKNLVILCVIIILHQIFLSSANPTLIVNGTMLFTVFMIAYFSLKQKEIFPVNEEQETQLTFITEEEPPKEKKKVMANDEMEPMKQKLLTVMKEKQPHLESDLNLVKLSELISVTPHQLSYIINNGFNENFFQFVNRHRVEKAKELLGQNDNLTMIAIAFDSGFNSKTSFNTTFKKMTEQTPTEYKKSCSNL